MNRYLMSTTALAAALLSPAAALAGEDDITTVDAVVAIGTRDIEGVRVDRVGGSLSVLDSQDLEDRQTRIVSDVLRDIPGVAVSRVGAPGNLTQIRIRGSEANHTLTLVDGIEANDPFQGEFDYAGLLADDLARVEVLRGQQSALYGSDAIAGVVAYSTPTGRQAQGFRFRAEGGSFSTWGAAARYGGVRDNLDYVFNAAFQRSGGYPTQTDGLGTRDLGSQLSTWSAKVNFRASEALTLRAVVRQNQTEADINHAPFASGSLVLDSPGTGSDTQSLYWLASADYEALEGLWSHSLQVQGVNAHRDNFNASGFQPGVRDSRVEGTRLKYSYVTTFRIEGERVNHAFTGAVDHERETFDQPVNPFGAPTAGREVKDLGLVLDYAAQIGDGSGVGLSWRRDNNDLFQDASTYRVQAYHRFNDTVRVRAAAGTGIKNPGQFELYGFGPTFEGNPGLKAEESQGWEAGADFSFNAGRAQVGFTWFDSTLKNEIFSYFGGPRPASCPAPAPGNNTACNRDTESTQQGFELFAHAEVGGGFTLDGSYTSLDAQEGGFEEIRRPPTIASATLGWRSMEGKVGVTLNVRHNGKQQDSNFSVLTPGLFDNDPPFTELPSPPNPFGRVQLPAYTLVNLGGVYDLNDRVQLFGRVENLLDEDYYEVTTFRTPGRAAYVGLRAKY